MDVCCWKSLPWCLLEPGLLVSYQCSSSFQRQRRPTLGRLRRRGVITLSLLPTSGVPPAAAAFAFELLLLHSAINSRPPSLSPCRLWEFSYCFFFCSFLKNKKTFLILLSASSRYAAIFLVYASSDVALFYLLNGRTHPPILFRAGRRLMKGKD